MSRDDRSAADVDGDTPMTGTYVRVVIVEAAILIALWLLGQAFT